METSTIQTKKTETRSKFSLKLGIEPLGDYSICLTRKQRGFSEFSCDTVQKEHTWLEGDEAFVCSVCGDTKDKNQIFIQQEPAQPPLATEVKLKVPGCRARLLRIEESRQGPQAVVGINGVELYYVCAQRMPAAPFFWKFDHAVPNDSLIKDTRMLNLTVPCAIHKHYPAPKVEEAWLLRSASSKH